MAGLFGADALWSSSTKKIDGAAFPAQRKATMSDSRKGSKETDGLRTPGRALIWVQVEPVRPLPYRGGVSWHLCAAVLALLVRRRLDVEFGAWCWRDGLPSGLNEVSADLIRKTVLFQARDIYLAC